MITNKIIVEKVWGHEEIIVNKRFCGKILNVKHLHQTSIQMHNKKVECLTPNNLSRFNIELFTDDLEKTIDKLTIYQCCVVEIPNLRWHRISSYSNPLSSIIEVSTHHDDKDTNRFCLGGKIHKSIIVTSGAMDPIHLGHINYLIEAGKKGFEHHIHVMNSDKWINRVKKREVLINEMERHQILLGIIGVNEIIVHGDEEDSVCTILRKIRICYPEAIICFAKGGDRTIDNIPEVDTCQKYDIQMMFGVGGKDKVNSSSELAKKWKKNLKKH